MVLTLGFQKETKQVEHISMENILECGKLEFGLSQKFGPGAKNGLRTKLALQNLVHVVKFSRLVY